jgi:hypothetical protein
MLTTGKTGVTSSGVMGQLMAQPGSLSRMYTF